MLAPPDHIRRVDVLDEHVADRLRDGFKIDETIDVRGQLHASTIGRHKGRAAFILACGPSSSLVPEPEIRRLIADAGAVVWVTNSAFKLFEGRPYMGADYYMVSDEPYWTTHREAIGRYLLSNPFMLPVLAFDPWNDLRFQKFNVDMNLEPADAEYEPNRYFYGRSVGVYAATMALHCGCTTIYLLGHDLVPHGGKSHAHGVRRPEEAADYSQGRDMLAGYAALARHAKGLGVRVVNLSPISVIPDFERTTCAAESATIQKARQKKEQVHK